MASIPGAVFKAGKIHDDLNRHRKTSAYDLPPSVVTRRQDEPEAVAARMAFRGRSASVTTPPAPGQFGKIHEAFRERSASVTTPPTTGAPGTPDSGLSPAGSGASLRSFVGGMFDGFPQFGQNNVFFPRRKTSFEAENLAAGAMPMAVEIFLANGFVVAIGGNY